jgi:hypothetical protein
MTLPGFFDVFFKELEKLPQQWGDPEMIQNDSKAIQNDSKNRQFCAITIGL